MTYRGINPLIQSKVEQVVTDDVTRKFIYSVLEIEKEYLGISNRGKKKEYDRALDAMCR